MDILADVAALNASSWRPGAAAAGAGVAAAGVAGAPAVGGGGGGTAGGAGIPVGRSEKENLCAISATLAFLE